MKRADYEKQQKMMADLAASNPLFADIIKIAHEGMREVVNTLADGSEVIEVNGLTLKRGPKGLEPVFDDDKH